MGLTEDMAADMAEFSSNEDDFGFSASLTAPTGETATIAGFNTKHHLKLDRTNMITVNSKNASFAFSEIKMIEVNPDYPVRNSNPSSHNYQEVEMKNHLVNIADVSGIVKNYIVLENFADEALGLIVLIIGDIRE